MLYSLHRSRAESAAASGAGWAVGRPRAVSGGLNTRRAAVFWTICSGFNTQAGRPVKGALQAQPDSFFSHVEQSKAAWPGGRRNMLWERQLIVTPRFLAALVEARDKESVLMLWNLWQSCEKLPKLVSRSEKMVFYKFFLRPLMDRKHQTSLIIKGLIVPSDCLHVITH